MNTDPSAIEEMLKEHGYLHTRVSWKDSTHRVVVFRIMGCDQTEFIKGFIAGLRCDGHRIEMYYL